MNIGLFMLGALGALLVVYVGKQEIIPEFRPLFDIAEMENEIREHREHIKKTEEEIDDIQAKLANEQLNDNLAQRLTTVLRTSLSELHAERRRLTTLENQVRNNQIISRSFGFLIYIFLGGVFGFLLADKVQIEGMSGDLPLYFQSIVIGATWTSYLSIIGLRSIQEKTEMRVRTSEKENLRTIKETKKEFKEKLTKKELKAGETEEAIEREMLEFAEETLSKAIMDIEARNDATLQMLQRDRKRIL